MRKGKVKEWKERQEKDLRRINRRARRKKER
jgi:hypothetical protein